jgi:hypothetical protein
VDNYPKGARDSRFLGWAIAYGLTGDGREVVVTPRFYNTIMTIGPVGADWFEDSW